MEEMALKVAMQNQKENAQLAKSVAALNKDFSKMSVKNYSGIVENCVSDLSNMIVKVFIDDYEKHMANMQEKIKEYVKDETGDDGYEFGLSLDLSYSKGNPIELMFSVQKVYNASGNTGKPRLIVSYLSDSVKAKHKYGIYKIVDESQIRGVIKEFITKFVNDVGLPVSREFFEAKFTYFGANGSLDDASVPGLDKELEGIIISCGAGAGASGAGAHKKYKGRSYKVREGPRGGRYIMVKGKKVYKALKKMTLI